MSELCLICVHRFLSINTSLCDSRNCLFFGGEWGGDTHITGRHIGGGTHNKQLLDEVEHDIMNYQTRGFDNS